MSNWNQKREKERNDDVYLFDKSWLKSLASAIYRCGILWTLFILYIVCQGVYNFEPFICLLSAILWGIYFTLVKLNFLISSFLISFLIFPLISLFFMAFFFYSIFIFIFISPFVFSFMSQVLFLLSNKIDSKHSEVRIINVMEG